MKNNKVCCLINVRSCLAIILKFYIFWYEMVEVRCGCDMAGGFFTEVLAHSSKHYHQVLATEPFRLGLVTSAWGAVSLRQT
jgi:hypothetical protein